MVYIALRKPSIASITKTLAGPVETWTYRNFVVAPEMAVKLSNDNPGARYQGRIDAPGGPGLGGTQPYSPQASLDSVAGAGTASLHIDLRQSAVIGFRIGKYRSEPISPPRVIPSSNSGRRPVTR